MNSNDIKVSVLCLVYNHSLYLDECLKSLTSQKTNFKYEVIVHDDYSTDNSREIIEKYYKMYPEIIVPIYEKENMYSKGVKIINKIMIPVMKGKYFCFCEGDDYWIDENKLQRQYDFLENNPEYKLCVHNALKVNNKSKKIGKIISSKEGGDLSVNDFIIKGGGFVATNSIFSYSYLAKNLPSYFDIMSLDYIWQMYLSMQGKSYCFKEYMSAYRVNSINSWTEKMNNNSAKFIEHKNKVIDLLKIINDDTNYKYDDIIKKRILLSEFGIFVLKREYKKTKQYPYNIIRKQKPFKTKLKYFLDEYFPNIYKLLKKIKKLGV